MKKIILKIVFCIAFLNQLQAQCVVENMTVPTTLDLYEEGDVDVNLIATATGVKDARIWIFDHWGNKIFQSSVSVMQASLTEKKDIDTGWNGTKNGERVKEGLYVYSIEATCVDGTHFRKGGTVKLVKAEVIEPPKEKVRSAY